MRYKIIPKDKRKRTLIVESIKGLREWVVESGYDRILLNRFSTFDEAVIILDKYCNVILRRVL